MHTLESDGYYRRESKKGGLQRYELSGDFYQQKGDEGAQEGYC